MPSTEAILIEKCMKAWRFLYRRGFIEGFGHISARIPGTDTYMLTRHSLGRFIVPDDMLVYDASGTQLGGIGDRPGEAPIHHEIYRSRPDVHSIIHYHGMHATAFTTTNAHQLKPIHLMGTLFADGLPIYNDPRLVSTTERGVALIADEVFADYQVRPGACVDSGRVLDVTRALAFSLGGLSKTVALPQVKLGWIAVSGPDDVVRDAVMLGVSAVQPIVTTRTEVTVAALMRAACRMVANS